MRQRFVHITPRLSAALSMANGYDTVADVGCDHGRLTAALLQQGICRRIIASDISEPSLEKAKQLIRTIGLSDRVSFRLGDGLSVLDPYECDAIFLLGMGGTLMTRILDACSVPLAGAKAVILQPMRAQDDIRSYLHRNRFRVTDDRVVLDHGRYYQICKAVPGTGVEPIPDGFPSGFYDVGYHAFAMRDALLPELCREQLQFHAQMLNTAKGTSGEEVLIRKIDALRQIICAYEKENEK